MVGDRDVRLISAERSRLGFVFHLSVGVTRRLYVRRGDRRAVERVLRDLHVLIVDEWGARIDESQFEKEADPLFNRNPGPGFWRIMYQSFAPLWFINWRIGRHMRQSSDGSGTG